MPRMKEQRSRTLDPATLQEFLPTVEYWARHYAHRSHQVLEVDDLVVVGMMGLMDALARYSSEHNTLFKTYAEFRIRGEIVDELRRQDWMTRTERRKQKTYRRAEEKLQHQLGRAPRRQELAQVLPFPSQELDRLAQYESGDTIRPYIEGDLKETCPLTPGEAVELHDEVTHLLQSLPMPMRQVVSMRYYDDAGLDEIAQAVGLSVGRVSQLHTEGLSLLRERKQAA